ncbi:MAG TPA: type I-U CRISPR-associated protein Csx17, partial [Fibrobacteria bacterium]|nr:type I-U CRISPR-associated protein Csx17 [Fibrobacteria bacterium]
MSVKIHRHLLEGCTPTPLAHYLKALGVLRLVSQQKDKNCRGAWIDDHFVLATELSREELERFFLEEYKPTAILDPWNGGSGFYPKDNSRAMDLIIASMDPRLANLREALFWAKELVGSRAESPSDDDKAMMQGQCLAELRGASLDAVRAAFVLNPVQGRLEGKASYPSLLGTGWNDGRLDFANNFHQRITDLFGLSRKKEKTQQKDDEKVQLWNGERKVLLGQALWRFLSAGLRKTAIGQYLPGSAGGANSTTGADGDSLVNPWDFVLMLEGTVLFSSAATKRMNPSAGVQTSAPFSLPSHATGTTTSIADEYHKYGSSQQSPGRGEQWMPLWDRFLGCRELQSLLSEGRAQIGRVPAARPVDMARAISRLGVSRGITSFQRFGYLERNGQANFAIPLDRLDVRERPRARLIDEIAPWLDRLHRAARDKAPARLVQAERKLADAVFAALIHDDTPRLWQNVLLAAVEIESIQATGIAIQLSNGTPIGPIPRLSPDWIFACLGER